MITASGFARLPGPADTLPESPCWQDATQQLFWVDHATTVLNSVRFPAQEYLSYPLETDGKIRFAKTASQDTLLIGSERGLYMFNTGLGTLSTLPNMPPVSGDTCVNDGALGPDGTLVLAISNVDEKSPLGGFFQLQGENWICLHKGVIVANGPAFSPDGRCLFMADTFGKRILRHDIDAGKCTVFQDLSDRAGYPDGLFTNPQGNLYVSYWGGASVEVFSPVGNSLQRIQLAPTNVTCACEFTCGGQRYLAVTACHEDPTEGSSGAFLATLIEAA